MADTNVFKLFRTVDPTTVKVPIKEKFANLTLSSNKKKQLKVDSAIKGSRASRQLLNELNESSKTSMGKSHEHPLLRSTSSSSSNTMGVEHTPKALEYEHSQLDVSECMEVLQLSGEGCTQRTLDTDVDVEGLSTQVSNMKVEPNQRLPAEVSICISSTIEEDMDDNINDVSCITISDSSGSECTHKHQDKQYTQNQDSMAVSEQPLETVADKLDTPLSNEKVAFIQAFLRDVSFERREMQRRGIADETDENMHSRLASADTESMSQHIDCITLPTISSTLISTPAKQMDSSKRLADNDTEVNTTYSQDNETEANTLYTEKPSELDCSKRLAANETEANTLYSEKPSELDFSKRLADNETEVNTIYSEKPSELNFSKRLADNETEVNTICSEEPLEENSSKRFDSPLPDITKKLVQDETEVNTPDTDDQLSDLSAHQSTLDEGNLDDSVTIPETCSEEEQSPRRPSSASSTDDTIGTPTIQVSSINISAKINIKIHIPTIDSSSTESEDDNHKESLPSSKVSITERQRHEHSVLSGDASEDEQFLTHAEKLLNQLYGKSWQTPDVIRTLKRSSGSGGKVAQPAKSLDRTPLTEIKRPTKTRCPAATSIKKRPQPSETPNESGLGNFSLFRRALHATKMNSTHLPLSARTEGRGSKRRVRTNHVDEDRWRALVDSDSGTDASDDDDADATDGSESDGKENDGNVTYLDLTKAEVEVVSNPDEEPDNAAVSKFPKRLEDILHTCRAIEKPKLPATPVNTTQNPTRRQLFTPNTGYEGDSTARRIVDQALDLDSLDQLENIYMPGTTVHKHLQEVKKRLGIAVESPKTKPIFKMPTPQIATPGKSVERTKRQQKVASATKQHEIKNVSSDKCSFIKSLESQISRDRCDNEAFFYRESFAKNKEQLAKRLYDMFNAQVFNNELNVPITWSKLLRNTAGRCKNKRRLQERSSVVELSVKVLTSADRLRCTLIHELCHAAAWVFNGEGGHGRVWKGWAQRANNKFPDLPPIRVCHNYNIEFKYTYKCNNCNTASHAHSRSRKVENLRCRICRGPITLLLNKKDKTGNIVPTPVREATGFAKFVKENFQKHKRDNLTAAQVMRILSAEYAKVKGKQVTKSDEEAAEASIVEQVEALILTDDD